MMEESTSMRTQVQDAAFVDAISGRHASTRIELLLAKRRMVWRKEYGWTYDAWVDNPADYALSGANGRFALPSIKKHFGKAVNDLVLNARTAATHMVHQLSEKQTHR